MVTSSIRGGGAFARLFLCACSIGKVTDGVSGQPVEHATVTFELWNTDGRLEYLNGGLIPSGYSPSVSANGTATTWAASDPGANSHAGMWYLNP